MSKRKKIIWSTLLLIFLAGFLVFVNIVDPRIIVEKIGITNSYLLAMAVGLIAGSSSFTSVTFFALVATLAAGGLNPVLLGLVTTPGVLLGDLIYFFFGTQLLRHIPETWHVRIKKFQEVIENKKAYKYIPIGIYIWSGFLPISIDLLMVFLAGIEYPLRKMIIPLTLGTFTFVTIVAFLGRFGFQIIS